jgi:hypothetical protein
MASYARFRVIMDLSILIWDKILIKTRAKMDIHDLDYESISFNCQVCHEHRHLGRKCPFYLRIFFSLIKGD